MGANGDGIARAATLGHARVAEYEMPNLTRIAAAMGIACLKAMLARLSPGDRSWLARKVVQDRESQAVRALVDFSYGTIRGWKNSGFDIHANGEAALLSRLRPFSPRMVLDVGANVGDWTMCVLELLPEASVHAFEIAPATSAILNRNIAAVAGRVQANSIGLSDQAGTITLFYTPESDTASTTVARAVDIAAVNHGVRDVQELTVPVTTGDAYLREHAIDHVDLLKIDVEGAELSVLQGFGEAFAREMVDLVQFEYGLVNLRTRTLLEDFYAFLEPRGFVIGKVYPHGVGFKPYDIADEDFIGLNFIACRRSRPDLINAIGCAPLRLPDP